MDLVISNTAIITGDGETLISNAQIGVEAGQIAAVIEGQDTHFPSDIPRLDAMGGTTLPGIINAHAHGCTSGPSMPSGSTPFGAEEVGYLKNRHLLAGTTTLLNVCGFALADEMGTPSSDKHPLRVFLTSAHSPSCLRAAVAVDGTGLKPRHLRTSVKSAIARGAVALGEGGGGQTLGGGAQDYRFLPLAIARITGVTVTAQQARALKEAALGRRLDAASRQIGQVFVSLCQELGLLENVTAEEVADAISASVMTSVGAALEGQAELVALSAETGVPVILHHAAPTTEHILSLARRFPRAKIIAAHSNHPSFTPQEAVDAASRLKEAGVVIDVSTLDCISTRWRNNADNLDALIGFGLVDTLSTDFAGGHWDNILEAVHRMVIRGDLSAPAAVALATGRVAQVFEAFANCGRVERGRRADLIVCDGYNLARVRHVVIGGQVVVRNGGLNFA